jgi:putative ABC transport system ATP-binding protein
MSSLVRLEGVTREYRRGEHEMVLALRCISLVIAPGEFVVIRGASGSGKSSLLNIIGCLDKPSAGTYELGGVNVVDEPDDRLSRIRNERIGFVFQAFHLLPRTTALENVLVPQTYRSRPIDRKRGLEVLARVGLGHRIQHYPSELSGGEQQRVAIARALINEPPLILADEPTGNLDQAAGASIMALLRGLHSDGRTIIMVTHDDEVASYAERAILLRDGAILTDISRASQGGTERP